MVVFEVLPTAEMYIVSVQWAVSTLPFSSLWHVCIIDSNLQSCQFIIKLQSQLQFYFVIFFVWQPLQMYIAPSIRNGCIG